MAMIITDDRHYHNIADAIRYKNRKTTEYYPSEMAEEILKLGSAIYFTVVFYDDRLPTEEEKEQVNVILRKCNEFEVGEYNLVCQINSTGDFILLSDKRDNNYIFNNLTDSSSFKSYSYIYNSETDSYTQNYNQWSVLQPNDLGYEFETDPNTDKIILSKYGKVVTCVLNWLHRSPSGSTYPTDQVEANLSKLELLRSLDNIYQSQWGRVLVYINIDGKYHPAIVVRDSNKNIINIQTIVYNDTLERIDTYIIQGTTIANYTQTQSPMLEYGIFDEHSTLGASQYVIAQWLYSLINIAGGIAGLNNNGLVDNSHLPIASASSLGIIQAGSWIDINASGVASVTIPAGTFDTYGAAAAVQINVDTLSGEITSINELIPNTATSENQLADKNFVNSSIATNTANFIGTFNSVAELEAYSGTLTNNDYAFVIEYDQQDPTQVIGYDRYKYSQPDQQWLYEYTLNNSSFTAEQWAAINSGMTASLVTTIQSHVANTTIHVTAQNKTDWDNKISSSEKGIAGGVPTLGNDGKVPKSQLPPTLPDGGTSGQVITKLSSTDGDADWENIPIVAPITGELTLYANAWTTTDNITYKQLITIPASTTNSKVDLQPNSNILNRMVELGINSFYIENNNGTLSAVAIGAEPDENLIVQYSMVITVSTDTSGSVVNVNDVVQTTGDLVILNAGTSTSDTSDLYPNANGQSF